MLLGALAPLFAVHISDAILQITWLVGGFVVAGVFAVIAAWRVRDEEIPQIALLTAAFFVASSIHIRVGPTSWHLLFNGLVGVILGRRAGLAIPIGLLLQYFLLAHGGFFTLGINTCILLLPALLASGIFNALCTAPWLRRRWFRAAMVGVSTLVWTLSVVYSIAMLVTNHLLTSREPYLGTAEALTFHPLTIGGALIVAAIAVWLEGRLKTAPEFALGLLIGELTVLATIALNYIVLVYGGDQVDWTLTARVMLVLHLPIAVLEGIVLGFLVGFLARVKPDMLGLPAEDQPLMGRLSHADQVSSNGAPHVAAGNRPVPLHADLSPRSHDVREVPRAAGQPDPDRSLLPGREPGH
jgi:ABC-type Co2+ transport system permease subunit